MYFKHICLIICFTVTALHPENNFDSQNSLQQTISMEQHAELATLQNSLNRLSIAAHELKERAAVIKDYKNKFWITMASLMLTLCILQDSF